MDIMSNDSGWNHLGYGFLLYCLAFFILAIAYVVESLRFLGGFSILVLLGGVLFLWKSSGKNIIDLGMKRESLRMDRLMLLFLIGLLLPILLVISEVFVLLANAESGTVLPYVLGLSIVKIILLVLIEETIFRGYFIQALIGKTDRTKAVIVPSILWASLHIPNMVSSGLSLLAISLGIGSLTVLGIALGVAFLGNMRCIWYPFGIHFAYNLAFSIISALFVISYGGSELLVGTRPWYPESGILGVLLTLGILALTYRIRAT